MREGERTIYHQPAGSEGQPKTPENQDQEEYVAHVFGSAEGMLRRLGEFMKTPKGKIARAFTIAATLLAIDQAMPAKAEAWHHRRYYYFAPLSDQDRMREEERQRLEVEQRIEIQRHFERELFEAYRQRRIPPAPILVQPIPVPYEQRIVPIVPQSEAQRPLSEGEQNLLTERAVEQAYADFSRGIFQKTPTPPKGYETNGAALWYYNLAYARAYAELGAQQKGAAPPLTQRTEPAPRPLTQVAPEARRETQAELRTALKAMAELAASETVNGRRPYDEDPRSHLESPDIQRFSSLPHFEKIFSGYYRKEVKRRQAILQRQKQSSLQDQDKEGPTFTIK